MKFNLKKRERYTYIDIEGRAIKCASRKAAGEPIEMLHGDC